MTTAHLSAAALLAEVRRLGLVDDPRRLADLDAAGGDAESAAARLVAAGTLTAFQVEQLAAGHGAGLVLRQYVLLDRIGTGGMGQVFRARHRVLGRLDAVKLLRTGRPLTPEEARRFRREARLAARCSHPNLVPVYDADEVDGVPYIAMELVPGPDLHRLVRDGGPLAVGTACHHAREAALGLHHAHEVGLVHRDVKPANLLLAGGRVRVTDLGLARSAGPDAADDGTVTGPGAILGTPDFMSPEQCSGDRVIDRRADVYALGCTLYFLLTGGPPFPGGTPAEKILRHLTERPTPVGELRLDIPAPLAAVVGAMLAREPDDRPPTAEAVADLLAPFCPSGPPAPKGQPPVAAEGVSANHDAAATVSFAPTLPNIEPVEDVAANPGTAPASRPSARSRWMLGVALVAVLVASALAAVTGLRGCQPRENPTDRPAAR